MTEPSSPGITIPAGDLEVRFVDQPEDVSPSLTNVDAEVVGVDVERADAHRYFRRAALIQVGVEGRCVLLDAVAIERFPEVDGFFNSDRLMVLHALQNDLEPLQGRGISPERVADTALAATVLGLPTGLGSLLEDLLGVHLDGDKSAYQRADWEARPIEPGMAAYAAGDVVHLPALWAELSARLDDAGRTHWYEQELAATIEQTGEDTRDWSRVKGSGRMSDRQRTILRAVWEARERAAREHDIAPNRLLHDDVLRDLATDPPATEAQLVRRSQRRRPQLREHAPDLFAAIEAARDGEVDVRSGEGRRWSDRDRALHDALRKRRAEVAEDLGLDAGILCPSRALWNAIAAEPEDGHELCELAGMRPWQVDLLADPLWEVYTTQGDDEAEDSSDRGDPDATST